MAGASLHDYFVYLNSAYSEVQGDLAQEQAKYDGWTMNAPGKEYYFKWINEQLAKSKKDRELTRAALPH